MKITFKQLMALCLCLVLMATALPMPSQAVAANTDLPQLHYGTYDTLSSLSTKIIVVLQSLPTRYILRDLLRREQAPALQHEREYISCLAYTWL